MPCQSSLWLIRKASISTAAEGPDPAASLAQRPRTAGVLCEPKYALSR